MSRDDTPHQPTLRRQLWQALAWFLHPAQRVTNPRQRQESQGLMWASLAFIPIYISHVMFANWLADNTLSLFRTPHAERVIIGFCFLLLVYTSARYGYRILTVAAGFYGGSLYIIYTAMVPLDDISLISIAYLIIILLTSAALYSIRHTLLLVAFQAITLLSIPLLLNVPHTRAWLTVAGFFGLISIISLVAITLRRRIDHAEREIFFDQEQIYRSIFNSSVQPILIHDQGRVVLCNEAAARVCGYRRPEDLIGRHFEDYVHPDDLALVQNRNAERIAGRSNIPSRYELRLRGEDGITRWVYTQQAMIRYQGQKVTMSHAVEITERKHAEAALHYRLAFDKLVTSISTTFLNLDINDFDHNIRQSLGEVGSFAQADCAYLLLWDPAQHQITTTYIWYAEATTHTLDSIGWPVWETRYQAQQHAPFTLNLFDTRIPEGTLPSAPQHIRQFLRDLPLRAIVECPVMLQNHAVGYLGLLCFHKPNVWQPDTTALLRVLGEIFISALNRKQSVQALQLRTHHLETLSRVGAIIASTLNRDALLTYIAALCCDTFSATSAYVFSWQAASETSQVLSEYYSPRATARERQSMYGITYYFPGRDSSAQPQPGAPKGVYWLMHHDSPAIDTTLREHMRLYDCKTILAFPLVHDERRIGIIELWDSRTKRSFSPDELRLLQAISKQVATAMNHTQLYTALQNSEARNSLILEALPDTVYRHNARGKFLDANPSEQATHTLPTDLLINRLPHEVLPETVADLLLRAIREAIDSHKPQIIEYDLRIDGQARHFESRLVAVTQDEILAFVRDITQRKQAEAHQIELSVERERVKILENFISNASHDLRTPIANLKSRLYLLQRAQNENNRDRQLDVINKELDRLEALIEDLLTMSQLDSSLVETAQERVLLNGLLGELVEANQALAEKKGLGLYFQPNPDLPAIVGSPRDLNRAFANLISNAINYTPQGTVHISSGLTRNYIIVMIKDEGIGIYPQELPYIFDRFYRADKARSTDKGGTGLGLAIAKRVIELHDGHIEVESTPDTGSIFRVYLPLHPGAQ